LQFIVEVFMETMVTSKITCTKPFASRHNIRDFPHRLLSKEHHSGRNIKNLYTNYWYKPNN